MKTLDWHQKCILIVEDDQSSAEYLQELLRATKVKLLYAVNGNQAMQLFQENMDTIDVVLMDIQLPDINGLEVTRDMKKLKKSVIVIAQTAFALISDKNKFLKEGCDDYIAKPIIGNTLLEKLSQYL
ncbi:MAG: response regulator [Bacteroidetes bacterium]|jgi:CheY-like chemotaxis protein|nr:response regulator [Bacteroidota bacterium]